MDNQSPRSFFQQKNSKFEWFIQQFPIKSQQFQLIDEFQVLKKGLYKVRQFKLINNYLIINSSKGKTKWMNYENSGLQIINDQTQGLGLILSKGKDQLTFYGDIEIWFNAMRRFAIQSNFENFYVIFKQLGSGSFAQVFLARNKYDGMEYAIKYVLKRQEITDIDRKQLFKEISILRLLQHESIMKFYETYETEDAIYIVTEYLKGGDLFQLINEKTEFFTEYQIALIIHKLLQIATFLHQKGIMHRDMKPENILFRKKGDLESLCLGDFGLADIYKKDGKYLFTRCGTPGFVAPELLQDQPYDFKVDVFSIGIIMYLLLTGREPFEGEYEEKVEKNFFGKIDLQNIQNLTSVGKDFIKRILTVNPLQRFSSFQALNHYWFQLHGISKSLIQTERSIKTSKNLQLKLGKPTMMTQTFFSPRTSRYQSPNKVSLPQSPNAEKQFAFQNAQNLSPRFKMHFHRNSLILTNKEKTNLGRNRIQNMIKY